MIRLTHCNQASKAGTYFRQHLAGGDNPTAPARPSTAFKATWMGPALRDVSLVIYSQPEARHLVRLGRGLHPTENKRLAPAKNRKRAYYDLTIAPPKTISLAALLRPNHPVAASVVEAHRAAVEHVVRSAKDILAPQRHDSAPVDRWMAAVFTHTHTREAEPHLHSHVVLPNIQRNVEGQWRAVQVNIAGVARSRLELMYGHHLATSLRRLGLDGELVMRPNGLPELKGLLPLSRRFSTATKAVLSAAKAADAERPTVAEKARVGEGELHSRSLLPVPPDRAAMRRRQRLADKIRKAKAKESDDPVRLGDEAIRWCQALTVRELGRLTRLLDAADLTSPRRPVKIVRDVPPALAVIVRRAWQSLQPEERATPTVLMRRLIALSAGRHEYVELRSGMRRSLARHKQAAVRMRAYIAAETEAVILAAGSRRTTMRQAAVARSAPPPGSSLPPAPRPPGPPRR